MYYRIEEYEGKYYIKMTDKFYNLTIKYFAHSYLNLMYRLFDMLPRDFYHYVGFVYNASFQKNKYINFINMFFISFNLFNSSLFIIHTTYYKLYYTTFSFKY